MTISHPRALLSVSDKSGLTEFAQALVLAGWEILSTGGTAKHLSEAGIAVTSVSDVTGFPEIMGGRVKTLHPNIHGGILADRDNADHLQAMQDQGIAGIEMVVITLYPFEQTVAGGATIAEAIEQIDIGGPAMIRAAAKNHAHVTIITDPSDYAAVAASLPDGGPDQTLRRQLAGKAFSRTAAYDTAISRWFAAQFNEDSLPDTLLGGKKGAPLRYGENPHQSAATYLLPQDAPSVLHAKQLQGKELSYNNIADADAAFRLVSEFEEPAVAIIKHANPCGVALGTDSTDAFRKALACDPVSAFGGIIALNRTLDEVLVAAIGKLFLEVIICPEITDGAAEMLASKKNLRVLVTGGMLPSEPDLVVKSVAGGYLVQERDMQLMQDLKVATKRHPDAAQHRDLAFAFTVAKHVASNAIVMVKDGATVGIGAGQMSRVDSVRLACWKAENAGLSTQGAVLASDAFFPFDDNVHHAAEAGIAALIQPGGSMRDDEVIAAADQHDMAMVMTGIRHFRH
jgi:phosphoribosylaminoimidazolecarboxamide formyltransferase/IMP cyclohydrolase